MTASSMGEDVIQAAPIPRLRMADGSGQFPVRRIYCVGRNFADHAKEMGADAANPSNRGRPILFSKPANALVSDGRIPYPRGNFEVHHEVELVVALGRDATDAALDRTAAQALVFAYTVGLDLTRRDLQAELKAKGHPWDIAKGFDASAPMAALHRADTLGDIQDMSLCLNVNGQQRQHGELADMIWDVPDILIELSKLYALKAGDVVMMGTPAGVAALQPGDQLHARLLHTDGNTAIELHANVVNTPANG